MSDQETTRRLTRYDMLNVSRGYDPDYRMVEQELGDWVRYDAIASALAAARAEGARQEREAIARLVESFGMGDGLLAGIAAAIRSRTGEEER